MFPRFILGLLAASALALGHAAAAADRPQQIIEKTSAAVIEGIAANRQKFSQDEAALQDFIREHLGAVLDQTYSARLVLGMHSRRANEEQIAAFAEALSDNLLRRYGKALLEVDPNTKVRVLSEQPLRDGQIVRVTTEVRRASGAPIPVQYLFRQNSEEWKVFDVIVEGISYVQTYRTQFDEPLRTRGLAKVTEDLRAGKLQLKETK